MENQHYQGNDQQRLLAVRNRKSPWREFHEGIQKSLESIVREDSDLSIVTNR